MIRERGEWLCISGLLVALALAGSLLPGAAQAQQPARIEADGVAGKPYGIGVLAIQLPPGQRMGSSADEQIALTERSGRVFFPSYESRPLGRLLRGAGINLGLGLGGGGRRLTVYFLFTGNQPLDLTLWTPQPIRYQLTPRGAVNRDQLLASWWRQFSQPAGNSYPQFHDFLVATLGRRFGLQPPAESQSLFKGGLSGQFALLSGSETLRAGIAREMLLGRSGGPQPLSVALPAPPQWEDPAFEIPPAPAGQPAVEPIALRVPEECFYLRTGNFNNFLWLRHRLEEWGGDSRNLISEQAVDYGLNKRAQQQMGLQDSTLGALVISDVALIGSDMFLREGAALGVLFQASSGTLLSLGLQQQRSALLSSEKEAKEEKLILAGKPVSLISTPDNRIRSFYVVDGDYHFITTSRALAERFLQTGGQEPNQPAGSKSLGASEEFRYARTIVPLERNDVAFVYMSRAFFRNLMSPHYQVEMMRRLRSVTQMELVMLGELLARGEGHPALTLDALVSADALPSGFGQRSDGSRLELVDGRPLDSLRGGRGTFVPVPDMPVDQITAQEAEQYEAFLTAASEWGVPDPMLVGIQEVPSSRKGLEHVTIDLQAAPLTSKHFEMLSRYLGPPAPQRMAPIQGNLVRIDASVRGDAIKSGTGDHFLSLGLQDLLPGELPADERPLLEALRVVIGQSALRGYVAAWPQPGLLSTIGGTANVPIDPAGYSHLITGVWRRVFDQFTVLSFHREVLESVTPQFRLESSAAPVQISARAEDLQGTNLAGWINREGFQRAARVSEGNARLLAMLSRDFHLPPDQCVLGAQSVLNATLVDPLGGKYELATNSGEPGRWHSTQLAAGAPANYQFPALTWIRGLDAQAWFDQGRLVLHAELEMPAYGTGGRTASGEAPRGKSF
jgi:hypothetical protein